MLQLFFKKRKILFWDFCFLKQDENPDCSRMRAQRHSCGCGMEEQDFLQGKDKSAYCGWHIPACPSGVGGKVSSEITPCSRSKVTVWWWEFLWSPALWARKWAEGLSLLHWVTATTGKHWEISSLGRAAYFPDQRRVYAFCDTTLSRLKDPLASGKLAFVDPWVVMSMKEGWALRDATCSHSSNIISVQLFLRHC